MGGPHERQAGGQRDGSPKQFDLQPETGVIHQVRHIQTTFTKMMKSVYSARDSISTSPSSSENRIAGPAAGFRASPSQAALIARPWASPQTKRRSPWKTGCNGHPVDGRGLSFRILREDRRRKSQDKDHKHKCASERFHQSVSSNEMSHGGGCRTPRKQPGLTHATVLRFLTARRETRTHMVGAVSDRPLSSRHRAPLEPWATFTTGS